ncbi:hypothetical protein BN1723_017223, partial [Verticillium longisporum]
MENWGCPAFWMSRTPVLSAFAAGKASALVIDVGGANTSVTAIHDGMCLKRSIQRSPVAGLWLSDQVRHLFGTSEPKIEVVPTYMVESKTPVDAGAPPQFKSRTFPFSIDKSFVEYENGRVITEFKESVVETWRGPGKFLSPQNEEYVRTQPGRIYEFPNGGNQMWREQRYRVSEGMWDEAAAFPTEDLPTVNKSQTIPELIRSALNAVDVDLRPNLLGNIVVTGSTSLLNGFNDRLNNELMAMFPGSKIKIHAAGLTTEHRRTLAEINKELERLNRNKARRKARESQKGIHHPKSGNGGDGGSPEPDKVATGTSRKCNNCGQVGHIKTNKNSFAPLPSFTPHHIVALSTRRTDDMGRRKIEIKAIKDDRNRS